MRVALGVTACMLMALGIVQSAVADHDRPWVRLELGIPIEHVFDDGVVYVSRGERYWVPHGYRDYRVCTDRRHGRHRHAHVYYNPGSWSDDRWRGRRWNDDDSDSDSDSDGRKHRRHPHYRSYHDYGYRQASGALVLTIPL